MLGDVGSGWWLKAVDCESVAACLKLSGGGEAVQRLWLVHGIVCRCAFPGLGLPWSCSILCSGSFTFFPCLLIIRRGAGAVSPQFETPVTVSLAGVCTSPINIKIANPCHLPPCTFSVLPPRCLLVRKGSSSRVQEESASETERAKSEFACSGQSLRLPSVLRLWVPHPAAPASAFSFFTFSS